MSRLVDADELLLNNTWLWYDENGNHTIAGEAIENAPTVDAEPIKHGKWISVTKGAIKEIYICSRCNRTIEDDGIPALITLRYPYCHCGAKMDGVKGDENFNWYFCDSGDCFDKSPLDRRRILK